MHERTPPERHVLRITILAVLLDRVLDVLASQMVLQLRCGDRDAIEEQTEVHSLGGLGVERELSRHGESVSVVMSNQLGRNPERGLAIREPDLDVLITDAVA